MIKLSTDQSIEQVFNRGFYEVPRFQRPYSWTADNIGDFWTDTIQDGQDEYFIGAVIVYEHGEGEEQQRSEYSIVDGQQRLTTITILLAALRDAIVDAGDESLARGVQQFIERTDRRNMPRYVVSTEGGFPYLQGAIQSFPAQELASSSTSRPDVQRIRAAYEYFQSALRSLHQSVLADSTLPEEARESA
jgi:hypothetical protein